MSLYYKRSQWKPGSNGDGWTTFSVRNEDADEAEARLSAEPSMSTTSPPENSGTDELLECNVCALRYRQADQDGRAKP